MDVLVTGGSGFVGSHVVEFYARQGHDVAALDNISRGDVLLKRRGNTDTARHNWRYLSRFDNVDRVEGDVRDAELVEDLVEGMDAVVHCAGQVAVTTSLEEREEDFSTNARGTFNVLEAVRKASTDPTLVFTSTNKVYGGNVNRIPVEEDGQRYMYADPAYGEGIPETLSVDDCEHTPYGASKLAADLYVQDYVHRNEIDAAVFRMSCIYGTRQFGVEDQGWVAHFIAASLRGEDITIYGDGKQVRDILWVKDLVRAFDVFIQDPGRTDECIFNIGGGRENTVSLLELLDIVEDVSGERTDVGFDGWREGDQRVYISDISRVREELGWAPTVSSEDGVKRFIEWFRAEDGDGV